jgi:uroporphyrinogen-III synthase
VQSLPLAGIGVLVTRPEQQAGTLCRLLEVQGAVAHRLPALRIVEHPQRRELLARLKTLPAFDLIVFISANAVRHGVEILAQRRDLTLAAVGPATARALNQAGFRVSIAASEGFDSEHLLEHPRLASLQGQRVLLVKGSGGRELLEQQLSQRGAQVETAAVYERRLATPAPGKLLEFEQRFAAGEIQLITATSLEIARHLFFLATGALRDYFAQARWVAPSARVAQGIAELGVRQPVIQAVSAEDQELLNAVLRWRSTLSGA